MGCGLWADALLLSSHIDAAMWKTVMARYAAEVSVAGSPLATLYSLFAGSGPGVLCSRSPAVGWRLAVSALSSSPPCSAVARCSRPRRAPPSRLSRRAVFILILS